MRVTKKLLIKLVNEVFDRVELPYYVVSIERSRFTSNQYEGGAWSWCCILDYKDPDQSFHHPFRMYCYIPFYEIEHALTHGKELCLWKGPGKTGGYLADYEITYRDIES